MARLNMNACSVGLWVIPKRLLLRVDRQFLVFA